MSKTKYTPGPWKYGGNLKTGGVAVTGTSGLICETLADITDDHRANARLIAAAPELLEALKYLVETYPVVFTSAGINQAKIAIAKAEGRDTDDDDPVQSGR